MRLAQKGPRGLLSKKQLDYWVIGVKYCTNVVCKLLTVSPCNLQCTLIFHWSSTAPAAGTCMFSALQERNLPWSDSVGMKITVVVDTLPSGLIWKEKEREKIDAW